MNVELVKGFLRLFSPADNLEGVTDDLVEKYREILPDEILALWVNFGFGNYGTGILKLIDPSFFQKNLNLYLKNNPNYIPFMITAFGDMFYFNKIDKSISLLSVHYKKVKKCANSIDEFLGSYIINGLTINNELRASLFIEAEKKLGSLSNDDIFVFVPSIFFGGKEQVENIQKADAYVYQDILYGD